MADLNQLREKYDPLTLGVAGVILAFADAQLRDDDMLVINLENCLTDLFHGLARRLGGRAAGEIAGHAVLVAQTVADHFKMPVEIFSPMMEREMDVGAAAELLKNISKKT